ncbi:MAG TPA: DUF4433 domain-containing protein [Microlunatus sp.]
MTDYQWHADSAFVARGQSAPSKTDPRAWMVWHFTHVSNLADIASAGELRPASRVTPTTSVADSGVKGRRQGIDIVIPDDHYPASTVSDHVPFYIAAKSPMLYVDCKGYNTEYTGGRAPLIFLGCNLGDVIDSTVVWCASNGNAGSRFTEFSRDLPTLGSFVDFDLLCERQWNNVPDDGDRTRRRAAEILVSGSVPLDLVTIVVAYDRQHREAAERVLRSVPGPRDYYDDTNFYY